MEEFKVLTDREHVLLRPSMYLGSVTCEPHSGIVNYKYQTKNIVPALIKMIEEPLQNSIDEFIRTSGKFAKNISINIDNTLAGVQVTISDDGRGIPLEKIEDSYRPVLAWTSLRAGSNFDDSTRVGAGQNGVGVSLTNIFSTSFVGKTCDGKNQLVLKCSNNMQNTSFIMSTGSVRGTSVTFVPDLNKFGLLEFDQDHIDIIRDRISNLAILYSGINFSFNSEKINFKNIKSVGKNFSEFAASYETDNIGLVFAPSGTDEEFRILSYVNGIYVKNGGSHIDFAMTKIVETLREHIKKKHKIDVMPNQIKQHLLFASWVSGLPAPRFDSQAKERLTNPYIEIATHFKNVDFDKISRQILNTPEIIEPIISAILHKKELADKLELAKKQKATSKLRVVNHIAAMHTDPQKRILYIVEGLSAVGAHISVRNKDTDGAYPLKGKVMNVRGMKPVDILKNKEISELLSIIGLEFGASAVNLNYGTIAIWTDSDTDGAHIFALLMNLFSNWPELFTQGRIVRATAPLYACTKGKTTKYFYTKEEFDSFNSVGYEVSYMKGLGSMSKEMYRMCLAEPRFIKVSADTQGDWDKLEMAFGDDSTKRKEWMTA
jgi:DNA topoisomerase-2